MKKDLSNILNIPGSKVMYNAKGKPEYVLVPIQDEPIYPVTDQEIVDAVNEVRQELSQQTDAKGDSRSR